MKVILDGVEVELSLNYVKGCLSVTWGGTVVSINPKIDSVMTNAYEVMDENSNPMYTRATT